MLSALNHEYVVNSEDGLVALSPSKKSINEATHNDVTSIMIAEQSVFNEWSYTLKTPGIIKKK